MKCLCILSITFCLAFLAHGQSRSDWTDSLEIIPSNPTSQDQAKLIAHVIIPHSGGLRDDSISQYGSVIRVFACYQNGQDQAQTFLTDTFPLGTLPSGNFSVYFLVKLSYYYEADSPKGCQFYNGYDSAFINFTVSSFSNLTSVSASSYSLLQYDKIYVNAAGNGPMQLQVFDVSGRSIYNNASNIADGANVVKLDIPTLPAGLYFYQLQVGDRVKVLKWVQP